MTQPMSHMRLARHGLFDLPVDVNNVPDGPAYETMLTVREMRAKRSLRCIHEGVWAGRQFHLASSGEIGVKMGLEANIFVLSIREGYEFASDEERAKISAGEGSSRNRVPTMDYVVTLAPLVRGGKLRYEALSHKPDNIIFKPGEARRAAREAAFFEPLGWRRSYVRRPGEVEEHNLLKLWDWGRQHPLDDGAQDARAMAQLLRKTQSRRPLWSLLGSVGRKLGIRDGDEFFVFAAAFYLGYIGVDIKNYALDEELSLVQKPPPLAD